MTTPDPFAYGAKHSRRWDAPLLRKVDKAGFGKGANAAPDYPSIYITDPVLNPAWPYIRDWLKEARK